MSETTADATIQKKADNQGWFFVHPKRGVWESRCYPDTDENWALFIQNPEIGPKEGACVRGAQYHAVDDCVDLHEDGTPRATNINVAQVWGALLDIDDFDKRTHVKPPTPQDILAHLGSHRFIIWTSWSHATSKKANGAPSQDPCDVRYKVYIPFSRPVQPVHYPAVFRRLLRLSGGLACDAQSDISRLGYLPKKNPNNPNAYTSYIHQGSRYDPYAEGVPEVLQSDLVNHGVRKVVGAPVEPEKGRWCSREEAIEKARAIFGNDPYDVGEGNRHKHLMQWACKLWWDFWLEYDDVEMLLLELNSKFPMPKSAHEVRMEVDAAWKRTRGPSARQQVHGVTGEPKAPGCLRLPPPPPTPTEWLDTANKLKRSSKESSKMEGKLLMDCIKVQKDNAYKAPDDPASFYLNVAEVLGREAPDARAEDLFEVLRPSWQDHGDQDVSQEALIEEINRAAQKVKTEREKEKSEEERERALRIKKAFATINISRDTPYTTEELVFWASRRGLTIEQLKSELIIRVKNSFHFFINGDYTINGFPKDSLLVKAEVMLAPFSGTSVKKFTEKGQVVYKTPDELQSDYCTIAAEMQMDFGRPFSGYAADDKFCISPVKINANLNPRFIPEIDGFLRYFSDYDTLEQWLAWFPWLGKPLPMLYVQGGTSSGKSLLAKSLSHLWSRTTEEHKMEDAVGKFKHAWVTCPLFIADEALPPEIKKNSAVFRDMITTDTRKMERKNQDTVSVKGYARFILTANNANQLPEFPDEATEQDIEAVDQRVFHTIIDPDAKTYLERTFQDVDVVRSDNLLASHVLWLAMNKRLPDAKYGRFPIVVPKGNLHKSTGRSNLREQILALLLNDLRAYDPANAFGDSMPVSKVIAPKFVRNKPLLAVSLEHIKNTWQTSLNTVKDPPSNQKLLKALNTFCLSDSSGKPYRTRAGNGKENRYCVVPEKLASEADKHDFSGDEVQDLVTAFFEKHARKQPAPAVH